MPDWETMDYVPLRSIFGDGELNVDGNPYRVRFHNFNTFFGDVALTHGKWYYEVRVVEMAGKCQFGWATEPFLLRSNSLPPEEQVCVPLRSSRSVDAVGGARPEASQAQAQGAWTWLPSFSSRCVVAAYVVAAATSQRRL